MTTAKNKVSRKLRENGENIDSVAANAWRSKELREKSIWTVKSLTWRLKKELSAKSIWVTCHKSLKTEKFRKKIDLVAANLGWLKELSMWKINSGASNTDWKNYVKPQIPLVSIQASNLGKWRTKWFNRRWLFAGRFSKWRNYSEVSIKRSTKPIYFETKSGQKWPKSCIFIRGGAKRHPNIYKKKLG